MKKKILFLLVFIFSVSGFCDTITGIIKTIDNKPIADAKISVFAIPQTGDVPVKISVSKKDGRFSIDGLETGYYKVVVEKKGFCNNVLGRIQVNQAKYGIVNYEIVLNRPGTISGFVYNPEGTPVVGAKIFKSRDKYVITNKQGFYKIDGLNPGKTYIYVEAPGFVKDYRDIDVEDGKETAGINFNLSYAGSIKGVIVDSETGKPIKDANVSCSGESYGSAKTDATGYFFIDFLKPGSYRIEAYRQGYEAGRPEKGFYLKPKETTDIGKMPLKLRSKYFYLNSREWLFTSEEKVKLFFNAFRIENFTADIYEVDLFNEINRSKSKNIQISEILMNADLTGKSPVSSKKFDIKYPTPLTELYDRNVSLGQLPEGAYVFVLKPEGLSEQRGWFFVSDIGFISKVCDDRCNITVFSTVKNSVLPDVSVFVFDYLWNLKTQIKTDINGQVDFDNVNRFIVVSGKSFAISDTVSSRMGGFSDIRMIYGYTDRPVYRPSQTVYFKAIPRIDMGDKYSTPDFSLCRINIKAPDDSVFYETTIIPTKTGSIYGSYMLPDEPPLGIYRIEFITEGKDQLSGSCNFKVLEYRKPEFSIEIKTNKNMYLPGEKIKASFTAKYYFGTPVKNTDVLWSVYSKQMWDYEYEDEWEEDYEYGGWWKGGLVCSGKAKTDENGIAFIEIPTKSSYDQKQTFTIEVKMTDESRREITQSAKVIVVPGSFEILIKIPKYIYTPEEEIPVVLSIKPYEGQKISGKKQLKIMVSQETYDQKKRRWNFKEIFSKNLIVDKEETTVNIKPGVNGYIRIDAQGIDQYNNIITATRYVWVTSRDYYSSWYGKKELEIVSDKIRYNPGEIAKVLVNSSYRDLTLLYTIEGNKIFENKVIKMNGNSVLLEIPIKEEYKPNIYVTVCSVKNKNLLYSSKSLGVSCDDRFLNVEVTSDREKYRPAEKGEYLVKITDNTGKPVSAEFSLSVVDEAIYAISNELVQKIEDFFYGSKRNRVGTSYSFYRWYYGGAGKDFAQQDIRRNFKDTAFWLPFAYTDENGIAKIQVEFPDNLTTWRSTIRAITSDTKVGTGKNSVITAKPLMANLITPRFLVEDDRLLISGVIHNYTGNHQKIYTKLHADGLDILDEPEKTIELDSNKSTRVDWKVKVNSVNQATITLYANCPAASDGMELNIPVFLYGSDERYVFAGQCSDTRTDTFYVPVGTIPASVDIKSYIYPSLVSGMFTSLDKLAKYPYGCIEQTLSGFLPAIGVADALTKIKKEDLYFLASDRARFEEMLKNLPKKVSDGLIKLYNYQNDDGGWGWWQNDASSSYTTGYVMFGLSYAKKSGYLINEDRFQRGKTCLKNMIMSVNDYNQKAFMLYALTYSGEKNSEIIEDVYKNKDKLAPYTMAQLCLVLKEVKDQRAKDVLEELCSKLIKPTPYLHYWLAEDGNYSWIHHNIETTAWGLRAILAIDPERKEIPGILRYLVMKRQGGLWTSTKDTAICLFAFTDYLKLMDELSPDYTVLLSMNEKIVAEEKIDRESIKKFVTTIDTKPENLVKGEVNSISIEKKGEGNLYYSHVIKFSVKDVSIPAFDGGFKVSRRYTEIEPREITTPDGHKTNVYDDINRPVKSNEKIRVEIKISGSEKYEYIMIEDPIPSGCEVANESQQDWWYCRKEVRDEKVAFFTTVWGEREKTIVYYLRAETPGSYHILQTKAQLMYLPEVWGSSAGNTLIIE